MQKLEEDHRTEIKVYMQKVKHLEYEHENECQKNRIQAQDAMKEEKKFHVENEKHMLADKKKEKDEIDGEDRTNQVDIASKEKEHDVNLKDLEDTLNQQRTNLIDTYERKMIQLREELELREKVDIHEIEERKNQHINDLMQAHESAFKEMKEYYNDITK